MYAGRVELASLIGKMAIKLYVEISGRMRIE
jgi:hypothetical protein